MTSPLRCRTPARCFAALMLLLGCAPSTPVDRNYDAGIAKQTLLAALDAWKAGKQNGLAARQPPIRLADEEENDGCRLLEYELIDSAADIQPHQNVPVRLVLRDTKGRRVMRETYYQVALEPSRAVLRAEP